MPSSNNEEVVYGADEPVEAALEGGAEDAVEIPTKDPTQIRIGDAVGDSALHVAARDNDDDDDSDDIDDSSLEAATVLPRNVPRAQQFPLLGMAPADMEMSLVKKVLKFLARNVPRAIYKLNTNQVSTLARPDIKIRLANKDLEAATVLAPDIDKPERIRPCKADSRRKLNTIDATMYKLIVEGKLDDILKSQVSLENLKCKEHGNSVLHIAASAGQSQLITELRISKGVIKETNNIGDLAFHTAAKAAQYDSLKALINIDKSLLGEKNDEGDTTLHIVLGNDDKKMGLDLFNEFCEACYQLNDKKICPLYLGIKSECWEIVEPMVMYTTQHKNTVEPILLQGKSVVHAAIEAKNTGTFVHAAIEAKNTDILKLILDNHKELIKSVDDEGQSPLSYAAFKGHLERVQYLLKNFPEYAYEYDKEGSLPIHKAACSGNVKVIQKLHMTKNLLNKKGQSILHLAAQNGMSQLVSHLINMPELKRLINLKDEDGNTPLHLATGGFHPRVVYILTREKRCSTKLQNNSGLTALDIIEVHVDSFPTFEARLTWMALRYVDAPRSPQSIRKSYYKQLDKDGEPNEKANSVKELDGFKTRVDTHMLIATLVATVTFAAGFTLPGGYIQSDNDPNIGMAVLPDKWPFKAFIICNTAALYSAVLCVVTLIWAHLGDLKLILVSLKFALPLLGFALVMMCLAFMMGIFVVLRTVPWLSYVVLGMGCVFLFGVLLFFIPLYNPSSIKNSVVRFFFSGTYLLLLLVCEKSSITYA